MKSSSGKMKLGFAACYDTFECKFRGRDTGSLRYAQEVFQTNILFHHHVVNHAAGLVHKVTVLYQIRAEAGRLAFKVDLAHQTVLHQCLEAIVNRGERDSGKRVLDSYEKFAGRRVIPLFHKSAVNFLTLTSQTEPGHLGESVFLFTGGALGICGHRSRVMKIDNDYNWVK